MSPHAAAMDAAFLERLPAPPSASAVCVVDTGVSITPDTQTILLERRNVAGGASLDDLEPGGHGTQVASLIAAARNGWGGVGIWPGAGIVSVRASDQLAGETAAFGWPDYVGGINDCTAAKLRRGLPVVVTNLSLAGGLDPGGSAVLIEAVADAHRAGISVVVAAGDETTRLHALAGVPGVIAVAGHDAGGTRCAYSPARPGLLMAPGCSFTLANLDGAMARRDGTSFAAAGVSALLAAIRAYSPLDRAGAEAALLQGSPADATGLRRVSAAGAFRAAGLEGLIPPPAATPPGAPAAAPPPAAHRSPPPVRLRALPRLVGRTLTVAIRPSSVRRGVLVRLRVNGTVRGSWRQAVPAGARALRLRVPAAGARASMRLLARRPARCAAQRMGAVCIEWRGPGDRRFTRAPVRPAMARGIR